MGPGITGRTQTKAYKRFLVRQNFNNFVSLDCCQTGINPVPAAAGQNMPFDHTFWVRIDSSSANNPALNLKGDPTFEVKFVAASGQAAI